MKKFLLLLFLFFVFNLDCAYGASSDDVYLRKDVFDARMDAFMAENRLMNSDSRREMDKRFNEVDKQIHEIERQISEIRGDIKAMNERIDGNYATLSKQIDGLSNFLYLILVLIGAIPFIQRWLDKRELQKEQSNQSFTLEDVKKLINEAIMSNNLSLQGK